MTASATPEPMRTKMGLRVIRRSNDHGHHYFIANLSPDDKKGWVNLAVDFKDAMWFNPLNGNISHAETRDKSIYVDLKSGESMILQTYDNILPSTAYGEQVAAKDDTAPEEIDLTNAAWRKSTSIKPRNRGALIWVM